MSNCNSIQLKFSEYLDGRLTGHEMQEIGAHLEACGDCEGEWTALKQTKMSLAALGPIPQPQDLLLRIRVAVSQERARSRKSVLQTWKLAWENTVGPFMLQASAGLRARCSCWVRSPCWWECLLGPRWRGAKTSRWAWLLRRNSYISPLQ